MLLDDNLITREQLAKALNVKAEKGGYLGQILVELGHITQDTLTTCLVTQCKIPHLSLLDYKINRQVTTLLPEEVCLRLNLLPIDKLGRILTVAMVNPLDAEAMDEIQKLCPELRIKPILCDWNHYRIVAERFFGNTQRLAMATHEEVDAAEAAASPPQEAPPTEKADTAEKPEVAVSDDLPAALPVDIPAEAAAADTQGGDVAEAALAISGTLRETMESSIRDLTRELAAMTVQLKTVLASSGEAERRIAERQTVELAERLGQAIAGAREGQAGQPAQLERIAEAAMQSVRQTTELVESRMVAENNRRDLTRGRGARHASVTPFGAVSAGDQEGGTGHDESDALILDALLSEIPLESLTFGGFFPGNANAFTFKVCRAVADAPGGEYNPLFLYGSVGTGKTHLISAVGNQILAGGGTPSPRVGYVSASHFARRLAEAAADNAVDVFREHYCHWDMLILDDIQFLGGRVEAQEEFFHIFNALYHKGRQIIIAADKAPDRLGLLEQRLVSRFASGIVAELKAPEWETRMQILRHQTVDGGTPVPEEILSLIAMRVPGDVRKMTGALRKITAFAKLIGKDITVETAQEILSHLGVGEAA